MTSRRPGRRARLVLGLRARILAAIDRSSIARVLMARAVRLALRRRGPLNVIADEAVDGAADREAKRTAEMLLWSSAVQGDAAMPKHFPVAHHVTNPDGRALSVEALRSHLEAHPEAPAMLWRQYFYLSAPTDLGEVASFVERDLNDLLAQASTRPPADREAVPAATQLTLLERATAAIERCGARPFLVSGTLLGFVREGRLMDHDYDVDLGVLPGETDASTLAASLESAGFDVTAEELKVVARDSEGAAVDVFLHYERDGLIWHGTEIHEWWNTPFDLIRSSLEGVPVWIPDDTQTYLDENYGVWDRPIAFYNFSFDTPNRRYRSTHRALLYLHRRVVGALDIGDRWTVESASRELRDQFGVDITASLQPTPLIQRADRHDPA